MRDPRDCLLRAARCADFAHNATSSDARQMFVELAQAWLKLAVHLESTQTLIDALALAQPAQLDPSAQEEPDRDELS